MSEYQRIAFRAIDGPVRDKDLAFMRRQSTRAEITPWSFDNEYEWGDFHGDALEMLRRGYDFHLHYANFGVRKLLIRLPYGLPDAVAADPYMLEESLELLPDKSGPGGTLAIDPAHEPGDLEDIWDVDPLIERLVPLRAEILAGDLRPLYLAHLGAACDMNHDPEETTEAPVPAGLQKRTDAQNALAELYGLSDSLLAAAARESPPLPGASDGRPQHIEWLRSQPQPTKDAWLAEWMSEPQPAARREMLAAFQKDTDTPAWPTAHRGRTIAKLQAAAHDIANESKRKAAEKAAKARTKRLADFAKNPDRALRQAEELVCRRNQKAYEEVATLLADVREALAGSDRARLPEEQAQKLRDKNPTLRMLVSELRRKGFLPKGPDR